MENNKIYSNKINILKALAILIVVSGHLEFSLIPLFPPYSFQVVLFFFIAGMLFKDSYSFFQYFFRRIKSLLIPYFLYSFIYSIDFFFSFLAKYVGLTIISLIFEPYFL